MPETSSKLQSMKILTWNINGIRASKRCLKDVLDSLDADVICLQETKITRDMLDEPSAIAEGYNAYFSFSRKRSGYSGTANFCGDGATPNGAEEGLSGLLNSQSEGSIGCLGNTGELDEEELRSLDGEGRAILTQHQIEVEGEGVKEVVIINVYVPRAADRDDRWTYKLHFLALLQSRAESLLRHGKHVIVLGDINTTHKRIDHCDPTTQEFLRADSRQWMNQFLRPEDRDADLAPIEDRHSFEAIMSDAEGGHFIDAFRFFYPEQTEAYTNWSTVTSARQTNYGKRLDYILVDQGLQNLLQDCRILADFEGSDHCPVVLHLQCRPLPASKCPPLCTKFMPEFQGRQQKLLQFFTTVRRTPSTQEGQGLGAGHMASEGKEVQNSRTSSKLMSPSMPTLPSLTLTSQNQESDLDSKSSQKAQLKRTISDNAGDSRGRKKKRGKGEKSGTTAAGSAQGNLLSFFHRSSALHCTIPNGLTSTTLTDLTTTTPTDFTTTTTPIDTTPTTSTAPSSRDSAADDSLCHGVSTPPHRQQGVSSADCATPTGKGGQHTGDQSRSPYWKERAKGDSPPGPPVKGSQRSDSFTPSPSKVCLSSLTLIPDKGNNSDGSGDLTGPGTGVGTSAQCKGGLGQQVGSAESQTGRTETLDTQAKAKGAWKNLLSGPPPPPPCKGHREPCVLRTVKKAGPTKGRQFYVCARPEGDSTNKEARCDHFQWVHYSSAGKKKS